MADGNWLLVFRSYTTEELQALRDKLKASILALGTFTSQTVGGKSYTRDLRELSSQLSAVVFVLNERTTPYEGTILTDFSQGAGIQQGQPAGTTDQLTY
jgi:hypothetical protein